MLRTRQYQVNRVIWPHLSFSSFTVNGVKNDLDAITLKFLEVCSFSKFSRIPSMRYDIEANVELRARNERKQPVRKYVSLRSVGEDTACSSGHTQAVRNLKSLFRLLNPAAFPCWRKTSGQQPVSSLSKESYSECSLLKRDVQRYRQVAAVVTPTWGQVHKNQFFGPKKWKYHGKGKSISPTFNNLKRFQRFRSARWTIFQLFAFIISRIVNENFECKLSI